MQLFEMQGLLAGKCLPGDIKVNESLAEYLLRQLNQRDELVAKIEIVNGLMDTAQRLNNLAKENVIALQAKCDALATENERAAAAVTVFSKLTEEITEIICDEIGHERVAEILSAFNSLGNLPATNAAIAEIGAKAVDAEFGRTPDAEIKWDGTNLTVQNVRDGFSYGVTPVFVAANLRAGRKG